MNQPFNNDSNQYHFRPMREHDLNPVLEIEARAHSHPWTRGHFEDCLKKHKQCWIVEQQSHIVAYAIVSCVVEEAELLNITVDPDYHRQGLGTRLLEFAIQQIPDFANMIFLEVRVSNESAISLYNQMGFAEVGIRPDYYPAGQNSNKQAGKRQKEDALIFAKML